MYWSSKVVQTDVTAGTFNNVLRPRQLSAAYLVQLLSKLWVCLPEGWQCCQLPTVLRPLAELPPELPQGRHRKRQHAVAWRLAGSVQHIAQRHPQVEGGQQRVTDEGAKQNSSYMQLLVRVGTIEAVLVEKVVHSTGEHNL